MFDALKITPANPSFLDARDAILEALEDRRLAGMISTTEHQKAKNGIWSAFAKFGMGVHAQSNGASLTGIVADFSVPDETVPPQGSDIEETIFANLAIPDNEATGVKSELEVGLSGRVSALSVSVNITHTFIGDLQVSLISPNGRQVLLHDRSGSSTRNLVQTYRSSDNLALQAMLSESTQGTWTLKVADQAAIDVGTLNRWQLNMNIEPFSDLIEEEAIPAQIIPDNNSTGISSSIHISQTGSMQGIEVGIDITHTFIGDLRVELTTPAGQRVVLHDRSGFSSDNLIRTYNSVSNSDLSALIGTSVQGDWSVRVTDLAGADIGKFNRWTLALSI